MDDTSSFDQIEQTHTALMLEHAQRLADLGTWYWDTRTNIWHFSSHWRRIHGVSQRALSTADLLPIAHPDDRDALAKEFNKATSGQSDYSVVHRIIKQDTGETRWVHASGSPSNIIDGVPAMVIGCAQDITDLKRKEERLLRANEELSQFAYRTSHDLKAPLVTIKGLATAITEDVQDGCYDTITRYADLIVGKAESLENLVTDILNLARADLIEDEAQAINLPELLHGIELKLAGLYGDKDVVLQYADQADTPLHLPRGRIVQILENLISNAYKYADQEKPNRYVRVDVQQQGNRHLIAVSDNGLGIPTEYHDRVFSMFQRFRPDVSFGSGLGLHIVKKHVDALAGHISFKSTPDGTTFEIELGEHQ